MPTVPPLVAIELQSAEDSAALVLTRLQALEAFGVRYLWLISLEAQCLYQYKKEALNSVREFTIPEYSVTISHATIFTI